LEILMRAVAVADPSQIAEARREAMELAGRHGFSNEAAGRVGLVATELASNLIKHGGGGDMLVGAYDEKGRNGIELIALDRGRGMSDVAACLRDGYSSAGTRGQGLGAVQRQSDLLDIASWPGGGTGVLARIASSRRESQEPAIIGAVSVPKPGEQVCGDSWAVANGENGTLCVIDGLGHGTEAADASVEGVRLFQRFNGHQVGTLIDYIHGGLRSTRGAAVSIARYDRAQGKVIFAGIGNVAGVIVHRGTLRRMVSMPGTAGYQVRKIQSFDYPFGGGLVILYSDGLSATWTLEKYPNIERFHPTLIAALLYRDFGRKRDDATVLVGKWVAS
jgi:anti-sigma regulatory factor (Ser/Thr protein kinase)